MLFSIVDILFMSEVCKNLLLSFICNVISFNFSETLCISGRLLGSLCQHCSYNSIYAEGVPLTGSSLSPLIILGAIKYLLHDLNGGYPLEISQKIFPRLYISDFLSRLYFSSLKHLGSIKTGIPKRDEDSDIDELFRSFDNPKSAIIILLRC